MNISVIDLASSYINPAEYLGLRTYLITLTIVNPIR